MFYISTYHSSLGNMLLAADENSLVGLWNEGQKYYRATLPDNDTIEERNSVLDQATSWLDRYFAGDQPPISELSLAPQGTDFRQEVWKILCDIPYGEVLTYGEIARIMAKKTGKERMAGQAIGGAVGHNPISVIIPCHRVVGSTGSLTGYAGGVDMKAALLEHEGADLSRFS